MLRDNLAGLIELMLSSAGAHNLGGHFKRDKLGDAPGQPSWRSSLLSDRSVKFVAGKPKLAGWKGSQGGTVAGVLSHARRKVVHFGVAECPTQECTMQQLREAFPWDQAPRYVLRDRDALYGRDLLGWKLPP